jgi:hypothetical protein
MIIQDYLIIENNVVTNDIVWNGNTETWTPPTGATVLVEAETPTLNWEPVKVDNKITDWVLVERLGGANIGFTWNGTVCTTNQPKPPVPTA